MQRILINYNFDIFKNLICINITQPWRSKPRVTKAHFNIIAYDLQARYLQYEAISDKIINVSGDISRLIATTGDEH